MQLMQKNPEHYTIINTLPNAEQECLITNTIPADQEEHIINVLIKGKLDKCIVVYGKHCNDAEVEPKCKQLMGLGFHNIYVYTGGLFEWLLMQNIYDTTMFPTTKPEFDLLKYKPNSSILRTTTPLITND